MTISFRFQLQFKFKFESKIQMTLCDPLKFVLNVKNPVERPRERPGISLVYLYFMLALTEYSTLLLT